MLVLRLPEEAPLTIAGDAVDNTRNGKILVAAVSRAYVAVESYKRMGRLLVAGFIFFASSLAW